MIIVKIIPNDENNPPGKLADAELHFTDTDEAKTADSGWSTAAHALDGLKLIGFGIWERRGTARGGHTPTCPALGSLSRGCDCGADRPSRNVTFPARQYSVNGERRSFSLLRPIMDVTAQDRIREVILEAYAEYEEKAILDPVRRAKTRVEEKAMLNASIKEVG